MSQTFGQLERWVEQEVQRRQLGSKTYSDVLDSAGHQYVDVVLEGGGVLSLSLLGYLHTLECAGLRCLRLAGTSAGSLAALLFASHGEPAAAKARQVAQVMDNMPLERFIDGPSDDSGQAVWQLLQGMGRHGDRSHWLRLLWPLKRLWRPSMERLGLNRGQAFHRWLKHTLAEVGITTTEQLRLNMARTPQGWHLRDSSGHRKWQLEGNAELLPLNPEENYLCVIASDVSTETKVEFPKMACLYWENVNQVHPADYVRASMSIPFFFEPFSVPLQIRNQQHLEQWQELAGMDHRQLAEHGLPARSCFIDGALLSNFPIDVFHRPYKVPSRPTFGIRLQWRKRGRDIATARHLFTQMVNTSRYGLDHEFLRRNPDFSRLMSYIDCGDVDWLDFSLSQEKKQQLFRQGAIAAMDFLTGFDWEAYKQLRLWRMNDRSHLWRSNN